MGCPCCTDTGEEPTTTDRLAELRRTLDNASKQLAELERTHEQSEQ